MTVYEHQKMAADEDAAIQVKDNSVSMTILCLTKLSTLEWHWE